MKFKLTILLLTVVVTMGLLLGASAAQAADVRYDPKNPTKVIEIRNLEIGDKLYNVKFPEETTALELYGEAPGVYPFPDHAKTVEAVQAVNAVLNAEDPIPFYVGSEGGGSDEANQIYVVGDNAIDTDDGLFLDGEVGDNLLIPGKRCGMEGGVSVLAGLSHTGPLLEQKLNSLLAAAIGAVKP